MQNDDCVREVVRGIVFMCLFVVLVYAGLGAAVALDNTQVNAAVCDGKTRR